MILYCEKCCSAVRNTDNYCTNCGAALPHAPAKCESKQSVFFNNGKLYRIIGDQNNWYDARFLVSDGAVFDLNDAESISKIPVPNFDKYDTGMEGYGVTGNLDYVLRMKASKLFDRDEKELCCACLWKATELMLANEQNWRAADFDRIVNYLNGLGLFEEAKKAQRYLLLHGKGKSVKADPLNEFDRMAKSIRDSVFSNLHGSDLVVFHDNMSGCCEKCAALIGRAYSISGKSKKYPALPIYTKTHGNFHPGCRCSMSPYTDGDSVFFHGKLIPGEEANSRPFRDDRTPDEKATYQKAMNAIKQRQQERESTEDYYYKKGLKKRPLYKQ